MNTNDLNKPSTPDKESSQKKRSEKRKRNKKIEVRLTDEEYEIILNKAKDSGIPAPSLLRQVGTGFRPKSVADQRVFLELMRMHQNLNRVGGLIKLWLSERESKLPMESGLTVKDLHGVLQEIRESSVEIKNTAKHLL